MLITIVCILLVIAIIIAINRGSKIEELKKSHLLELQKKEAEAEERALDSLIAKLEYDSKTITATKAHCFFDDLRINNGQEVYCKSRKAYVKHAGNKIYVRYNTGYVVVYGVRDDGTAVQTNSYRVPKNAGDDKFGRKKRR